ncbi:hypothetical protein EON83_28115 [bacterium]|nr:MAG: hypothetical protein EON83_28115 [bacterium]
MKVLALRRTCEGLLAAVLLSSCAVSQPTTYLPNDLKVTPVATEPNDMADILELKTWRLNVTSVKVGQTLDCDLELREKGKPAQSVGGIVISPIGTNSQPEILIGLHPLGDCWNNSGQMKTFVRASGVSVNSICTGVNTNPFKHYSLASGLPVPLADGSFLLMAGNKDKSAQWPSDKQNDLTLVCTLKLKNDK